VRLGPEQRALAIAALAIGLGPAILALGFAPFDQRVGWLTVLACWTVSAAGLIAWLRNPFHAAAVLVVLAGFASAVAAIVEGGDGVAEPVRTVAATAPWLVLGHAAIVAASPRIRHRLTAPVVIGAYVASAIVVLASQGQLVGALNVLPDSRVVARVAESAAALGIVALVLADAARRQQVVDFILDLDPSTDASDVARQLSDLADRAGIAVDEPRIRRSLSNALTSIEERRRLEVAVGRELVELSASRRRIVEAADAENRQLRSDLDEQVGWRLRGLASRLRSLPMAGTAASAAALEHVVEAQRDIDAILEGLPPGDLARIGLPEAISALAARSPLRVRFSTHGAVPTDDGITTALYFTCSEALSNAIRHAGASTVEVELTGDERDCQLTIADDGVGGTTIGRGEGTGLTGVRDRLEAVGGRLDVVSPVGEGTILRATVPAS
jgi:signal transduction histidine kinase